jgi:AbrB family looped-hinge helix DNA binding protein
MSTEMSHRVTVRKKAQLTLPVEIRDALHVVEGDEVEFTVTETGEVVLRGLAVVPADQRWFWTEDWQAGEREAHEQIAVGDVAIHEDVDALFDVLDR